MNTDRLLQVIRGPHVSEKSTLVAEAHNQIALKVDIRSNKLEIKKAVESLFDVKIESVRTVLMKGKTKRFAQRQGKRNNFKKAYVSLKEGYDINFATTE